MGVILKADNISKQYRLGLVGTGTLNHDLNRWWHRIRGKEDPYLLIGAINDRSKSTDSDYVWALKDINFKVRSGEVLGIIGKNGAGKSTLLKLLSRVTSPTTGEIKTKGRIASLLEVGTGFHPELTGRENIYLNGAILGMTKSEINDKEEVIIDFSGCAGYIDTPVKRYSSGMHVRLAFAVAAHLEPDILVIDEVLAVGDAEFQKKAIGKMQDISNSQGRTVLFVSHNMAAVKSLCTRAIVLENGITVFSGETDKAIDFYLNNSAGEYKFEHHNDEGILKNIKVYSEEKVDTIFTLGSKLSIDIILRQPLGRYKLDIGIYNFQEEKITNLSTDYAKDLDKEKLKFHCTISKLMISDGAYYIKLAIMDNSVLVEFHDRILSFEILSSDYYDTGRVVSKVPGYIFIDQNWQ